MHLPVVFDAGRAVRDGRPWRWNDGHRARFDALPRAEEAARVRWFGIAPCCVWHTVESKFGDQHS